MNITFLVVAGGSGKRMLSSVPKQFLLLAGRPLIMHTLDACHQALPEAPLILVLPLSQIPAWEILCENYHYHLPHQVVAGGITRFDSVRNGLQQVSQEGFVAIHDGVRPFINNELINRLLMKARDKGNAIPALHVTESMRQVDGDSSHPVDRSVFVTIQTPQVFRLEEITAAYQQPYRSDFTDDASVLEAMGVPIHLVEGETENIKITTPVDLILAASLLRKD